MNNEYEFFKQFAGVTEEDLHAYKCGGKTKKVKKDCGGGCATKIKKHKQGGAQKYNIEQPASTIRVAQPEQLRNNKMTNSQKNTMEENRKKATAKKLAGKNVKQNEQTYSVPFIKKG